MKHIILSAALTVALTGSAAFAQQTLPAPSQDAQTNGQTNAQTAAEPANGHMRHHADPQHQAEFLSKKLNLTPDQTAKLEPILADRDQKFQALRQNTSLTPEQRHDQMKAIHQSTRQQLATVLTPDQLQQLKQMRHNHRGPHGPKGPAADQAQPPVPPSGL